MKCKQPKEQWGKWKKCSKIYALKWTDKSNSLCKMIDTNPPKES